jgi:release factor glutamine methyltransferase
VNLAQALRQSQADGLSRLDAQLLLLHALGRSSGERAWLLAHDADALDPAMHESFGSLCRRRLEGEPVAYLTGHKEFFSLDLRVDKRVLVPRPETETLVQWALDLLPESGTVIDLGTGSGAIALAIKKHRPQAAVQAVDASPAALEVAQSNALRLGLKVDFRQGSWLEGLDRQYDLIVSNPPYIAEADPHLSALSHEPVAALAAGADGLDDLRTIIGQAPSRLRPGAHLLLEHGWDQAESVRALLLKQGFRAVASRRDLSDIERCSCGQWLELG